MQVLFTNKTSHHDHLCHYFGGVNIQALSFFKENGATKIAFTEILIELCFWILKYLSCTFAVKGNNNVEDECNLCIISTEQIWVATELPHIWPEYFCCVWLWWSKAFKLEMSFIFLPHLKPKLRKKKKKSQINITNHEIIYIGN